MRRRASEGSTATCTWSLRVGKTAGDFHLYLCVSSRVSTFVNLLPVEPPNPIPDLGEPTAEHISGSQAPPATRASLALQDTKQPPQRRLDHEVPAADSPSGMITKNVSRHRPREQPLTLGTTATGTQCFLGHIICVHVTSSDTPRPPHRKWGPASPHVLELSVARTRLPFQCVPMFTNRSAFSSQEVSAGEGRRLTWSAVQNGRRGGPRPAF